MLSGSSTAYVRVLSWVCWSARPYVAGMGVEGSSGSVAKARELVREASRKCRLLPVELEAELAIVEAPLEGPSGHVRNQNRDASREERLRERLPRALVVAPQHKAKGRVGERAAVLRARERKVGAGDRADAERDACAAWRQRDALLASERACVALLRSSLRREVRLHCHGHIRSEHRHVWVGAEVRPEAEAQQRHGRLDIGLPDPANVGQKTAARPPVWQTFSWHCGIRPAGDSAVPRRWWRHDVVLVAVWAERPKRLGDNPSRRVQPTARFAARLGVGSNDKVGGRHAPALEQARGEQPSRALFCELLFPVASYKAIPHLLQEVVRDEDDIGLPWRRGAVWMGEQRLMQPVGWVSVVKVRPLRNQVVQ